MLHYAPRGLVGVLTPQANTTAEPELSILAPPGVGLIAARLTSTRATIDERLADYVLAVDQTLDRFANAPLGTVIFACTGASYLVDPAAERETLDGIENRRGYKVLTAADAIADALEALSVRRVAILSPYGDALHAAALAYWAGRGLDVAAVEQVASDDAAFHPIYALSAGASSNSLARLVTSDAAAILMLGTGLPTLPAVLAHRARPMPILSPNLCLMWRATLALAGMRPAASNLMPWLTGEAWRARYEARLPDPA